MLKMCKQNKQQKVVDFQLLFWKNIIFPVIKMTGFVHTTFLLNTTQSQWSQVPNTYMLAYHTSSAKLKTIKLKLLQT